jgi:hypothetical protein
VNFQEAVHSAPAVNAKVAKHQRFGEDRMDKVPVKMREWIGPALATLGFVLELQPPAEPSARYALLTVPTWK